MSSECAPNAHRALVPSGAQQKGPGAAQTAPAQADTEQTGADIVDHTDSVNITPNEAEAILRDEAADRLVAQREWWANRGIHVDDAIAELRAEARAWRAGAR